MDVIKKSKTKMLDYGVLEITLPQDFSLKAYVEKSEKFKESITGITIEDPFEFEESKTYKMDQLKFSLTKKGVELKKSNPSTST